MSSHLKVNDKAPEFEDATADGKTVSLSSLLKDGPVVLIFLRGFFWAYARKHLVQMKQDIQQFVDRKAQVVVIAPHETDKTKAYWEKESLPFIGIPDDNGKLGKLYGQEWNLIKFGRMPALFIVDQKGNLAFAQYAKNMADIPENSELFKIIDGLK